MRLTDWIFGVTRGGDDRGAADGAVASTAAPRRPGGQPPADADPADSYLRQVARLRQALDQADAVLVGAGAGLSTAAGLTYTGPRFDRWFSDFAAAYGFCDMYSGGFFPYRSPEEHWAYWSRYIYCNRYDLPPNPVYGALLALVRDKDYFVLTTNVDHQFQLAGFDKGLLFYTQGDYGLWQCSEPCHAATYDNEEAVRAMLRAQGFELTAEGVLAPPADGRVAMSVPTDLVPRCPRCGRPMAMNLRADGTFVEDAGWHAAQRRYRDWLDGHDGARVLLLELGVGGNTPVIIKYPFWQMTAANPRATYACLNRGEALAPRQIADRSICIDDDIAAVLALLR